MNVITEFLANMIDYTLIVMAVVAVAFSIGFGAYYGAYLVSRRRPLRVTVQNITIDPFRAIRPRNPSLN